MGGYCSFTTNFFKGNKLINIPTELVNLIKLEILDLSHNELISLPKEIGNLVNLRTLQLGHNRLTSIPNEIEKLTNLKQLNLDQSSYQIDNLDPECEILILSEIETKITNLPITLKRIYLSTFSGDHPCYDSINMIQKVPFGCEIKYDYDKICCECVIRYNEILN